MVKVGSFPASMLRLISEKDGVEEESSGY